MLELKRLPWSECWSCRCSSTCSCRMKELLHTREHIGQEKIFSTTNTEQFHYMLALRVKIGFECVYLPLFDRGSSSSSALLCSEFIPLAPSLQQLTEPCMVLGPCAVRAALLGAVSSGHEPGTTEIALTAEAAVDVAPGVVLLSPFVQDFPLSWTPEFVLAVAPEAHVRRAGSFCLCCSSGCADVMWKQSSS